MRHFFHLNSQLQTVKHRKCWSGSEKERFNDCSYVVIDAKWLIKAKFNKCAHVCKAWTLISPPKLLYSFQ